MHKKIIHKHDLHSLRTISIKNSPTKISIYSQNQCNAHVKINSGTKKFTSDAHTIIILIKKPPSMIYWTRSPHRQWVNDFNRECEPLPHSRWPKFSIPYFYSSSWKVGRLESGVLLQLVLWIWEATFLFRTRFAS